MPSQSLYRSRSPIDGDGTQPLAHREDWPIPEIGLPTGLSAPRYQADQADQAREKTEREKRDAFLRKEPPPKFALGSTPAAFGNPTSSQLTG